MPAVMPAEVAENEATASSAVAHFWDTTTRSRSFGSRYAIWNMGATFLRASVANSIIGGNGLDFRPQLYRNSPQISSCSHRNRAKLGPSTMGKGRLIYSQVHLAALAPLK